MKNNLFFTAIILVLLTSCDYYDRRYKINNKTSKAICFIVTTDTVLNKLSINKKEYYLKHKVLPDSTKYYYLNGSVKEWDLRINKSKNKTLNTYVFDYEEVKRSNWDSLRFKKQYVRYQFTKKELDSMEWKVIINKVN